MAAAKTSPTIIGFLVLACCLFPFAAGCGKINTKKKGPISKRLLGTWEHKIGFTGSQFLTFKDDNTLEVREKSETKDKSFTVYWLLAEDKGDQLQIEMQTKPDGKYEFRTAKFIQDDYMELKNGAKIVGRFQKK